MKKYFILITLLLGGIMNGQGVPTSPSSSVVKVYEMDASLKSDCSSPITIFKTASPTAVNLVNNPTINSGVISDGTYHCLMFHIDNLVTVVPQAPGNGSCTANVQVTVDIFSDTSNEVSMSPAGVTIRPNPYVEVDPWVYFSDSSQASSANNCFEPNLNDCACSGPCPLTPMTISADATHSLVLNLNNRLDGSNPAACAVALPPASEPSVMLIR
jgi:hypothetical protein